MASDYEQRARIEEAAKQGPSYLQKFRLYETCSNFYMIGRDKNRSFWRVLKIDRSEPSELNILEDSTAYSEIECRDLLRRMHEGNKSTGGLKFVTTCYGIVGFIKFLGPYYMLLITKRRKIGTICGHAIYAITKNEMIPVPNSTVLSNMDYSKNENRYKKLLGSVDLTKDFFFSYSYPVMHSLQKNLCDYETRRIHDETMFVWNEYLTRGIHTCLQNTNWTVALVYGFFEQIKLSISEKDFTLTLIARRSRHYAGTRYLKRGVNERGQVANDVETEQIVFDGVPEGCPMKMSSVVQNRGSIPLFWSQETSRLNIRPDIIISKKDDKYQATRLHFENLEERYGNPIIVLNLIKTMEKKPRESVLRSEFANAIALINKDLVEERRLKFLHWDLSKYSKSGEVDVLYLLGRVAAHALDFTGFFFCKTAPTLGNQNSNTPSLSENTMDDCYEQDNCVFKKDTEDSRPSIRKSIYNFDAGGDHYIKPQMTQNGVLRTNCIDCLDRTNVAQYAYGLIALGYQLCALGYADDPSIEWDTPLANDLMRVYETMGDTLALQYGGSAAHNKIFSQRRGQSKAATQSQEFFRTLQRYYSNAYRDAEKQDAINTFLGHIQPHQGKPTLQELNSDQPSNIERRGSNFAAEFARFFKRSLSEGNIQCKSNLSAEATDDGQNEDNNLLYPDKTCGANKVLSESTPDISTCDSKLSSPRYTSSMPCRQLFPGIQIDQCLKVDRTSFDKQRVPFNFSNFLDMDSLSSSGNSCEEDTYERSTLISSPIAGVSSDNALTGASPSKSEASLKDPDVVAAYSESFIDWVAHGDMLHC